MGLVLILTSGIDGSIRDNIIPADFNLLVNLESVVPALALLCVELENRTLQTLKDEDLSLSISGLPL